MGGGGGGAARAGGAGGPRLSAGRRDGGAVRLHQVPPALPLRGAQPGPAALQGPGEGLGAGWGGAWLLTGGRPVRELVGASLGGGLWERSVKGAVRKMGGDL